MRVTLTLCVLLLAAGCASRSPIALPAPDFVAYDYGFDGVVGSRAVSGTVAFEETEDYPIRYTLSSDLGHCVGQLRRTDLRRVRLSCGGLSFELVRGGRVRAEAPATLATTEPAQRRECAYWVDNERGQRVCGRWQIIVFDRPVTRRGTLIIQRVDPTGWTG